MRLFRDGCGYILIIRLFYEAKNSVNIITLWKLLNGIVPSISSVEEDLTSTERL